MVCLCFPVNFLLLESLVAGEAATAFFEFFLPLSLFSSRGFSFSACNFCFLCFSRDFVPAFYSKKKKQFRVNTLREILHLRTKEGQRPKPSRCKYREICNRSWKKRETYLNLCLQNWRLQRVWNPHWKVCLVSLQTLKENARVHIPWLAFLFQGFSICKLGEKRQKLYSYETQREREREGEWKYLQITKLLSIIMNLKM